jgi:hypothetical protein
VSPVQPAPERSLKTFTSTQKLRLLGEIVTTFVVVRWRMRAEPNVAALLADLRGGLVETLPPESVEVIWFGRRMGAIVRRVVGHLPGDTRCLVRSTVLVTLLARRGIATTLIIGVRSAPTFGAHAWVELAGNPLLEPIEPGGRRLTEF